MLPVRATASSVLAVARRLAASLAGCLACGGPSAGDDGVCAGCWEGAVQPVVTDDLLALGRYREPLAAIVRAGKFRGAVRALDRLGAALGVELTRAGLGAHPLVPVPRHPRRRSRYGVDAALRIAQGTGGRVVPALERRGPSRPQSRTPRADREAAVADVFRPSPLARPLRGHEVVLVDDVLTTGATARACRATLAAAGVRVAAVAVVAAAS